MLIFSAFQAKTVSEIQNVYKDMEKKAKDAAKSGDKQKQRYHVKMSYISPLVEVSKASLIQLKRKQQMVIIQRQRLSYV